MNNTTPSPPAGVEGGSYMGVRLGLRLAQLSSNPRNLRDNELPGRSCTTCKASKVADDFALRPGPPRKDGTRALYPVCQSCRSAYIKANYRANIEARTESNRAYRLANLERYKAYDARPERRSGKRVSSTRTETCSTCGVVGGKDLFFVHRWMDNCSSCRKAQGVAKNIAAHAELYAERKREKELLDAEPKTCSGCGLTGVRGDFYSDKILRDKCKPCRWEARSESISRKNRERQQPKPAPTEKVCARCKDLKTASEFRTAKKKLGAVLTSYCKSCEREKRLGEWWGITEQERQAKNKVTVAYRREKDADKRAAKALARAAKKAATSARTEKACTACKTIKTLEFFSTSPKMLDGHTGKCKACQAEDASNRRALDPEGYLAKMRARNQKCPGRQKRVQSSRSALLKHPVWSDSADIRAVYAEAEYMTKTTGVNYSVDHCYPLKNKDVCGLHVACNLRVITKRTNSKKLNKLPGHLSHELWDPTGPDVFHESVEKVEVCCE